MLVNDSSPEGVEFQCFLFFLEVIVVELAVVFQSTGKYCNFIKENAQNNEIISVIVIQF